MLPEQWQEFIKSQGGTLNANNEVEFSSSTIEAAFICDLSYLGVIEVSGEDRISFLQGQLTNDFNQITPEMSHLGAYCTPKGRMLALFRIITHEDKLWLLLPQDLIAAIMKRLQMFVLMSKVTFRDVSQELARIGVYGEETKTTLESLGYQLPETDNAISNCNGISLVKIPDDQPRYLCLGNSSDITQLWKQASLPAANTQNWKVKDILAGLPQVYQATTETFIPQMQNLQVLDGISFKKGCYTGQEVVARMQYLGKLKRQMYQLQVSTEQNPQPGDELYSPSSSSAQGAGKIVDAQIDETTGKTLLLAVLEISSAESNTIYLDEANTIKAELSALPYAQATA